MSTLRNFSPLVDGVDKSIKSMLSKRPDLYSNYRSLMNAKIESNSISSLIDGVPMSVMLEYMQSSLNETISFNHDINDDEIAGMCNNPLTASLFKLAYQILKDTTSTNLSTCRGHRTDGSIESHLEKKQHKVSKDANPMKKGRVVKDANNSSNKKKDGVATKKTPPKGKLTPPVNVEDNIWNSLLKCKNNEAALYPKYCLKQDCEACFKTYQHVIITNCKEVDCAENHSQGWFPHLTKTFQGLIKLGHRSGKGINPIPLPEGASALCLLDKINEQSKNTEKKMDTSAEDVLPPPSVVKRTSITAIRNGKKLKISEKFNADRSDLEDILDFNPGYDKEQEESWYMSPCDRN